MKFPFWQTQAMMLDVWIGNHVNVSCKLLQEQFEVEMTLVYIAFTFFSRFYSDSIGKVQYPNICSQKNKATNFDVLSSSV